MVQNSRFLTDPADESCYVCRQVGNDRSLMVCDHCNFMMCHNTCLPEPIDWIPEEDFYCNQCCERFNLVNRFERPQPFNVELYRQLSGLPAEEDEEEPQPLPRGRGGRFHPARREGESHQNRADRLQRRRNYEPGRGHIFGARNSHSSLSSDHEQEEVIGSTVLFNRNSTTLNYSEELCAQKKQARAERLKARQSLLESDRPISLPTKYKPSPQKKQKKGIDRAPRIPSEFSAAVPHENENLFSLFTAQDVEMHQNLYGVSKLKKQPRQSQQSASQQPEVQTKPRKNLRTVGAIEPEFDVTLVGQPEPKPKVSPSVNKTTPKLSKRQARPITKQLNRDDYLPDSSSSSSDSEQDEQGSRSFLRKRNPNRSFSVLPPPTNYVPFAGILQAESPVSKPSPSKPAAYLPKNRTPVVAKEVPKRFRVKAIFKPDWSVSQKSGKSSTKSRKETKPPSHPNSRIQTRTHNLKKESSNSSKHSSPKPVKKQPSRVDAETKPKALPVPEKKETTRIQTRSGSRVSTRSSVSKVSRQAPAARSHLPLLNIRLKRQTPLRINSTPLEEKPAHRRLDRLIPLERLLLQHGSTRHKRFNVIRSKRVQPIPSRHSFGGFVSPTPKPQKSSARRVVESTQPARSKANKKYMVERILRQKLVKTHIEHTKHRSFTRSVGPVDPRFRNASIAKLNLIIESMAGKRDTSASRKVKPSGRNSSAKSKVRSQTPKKPDRRSLSPVNRRAVNDSRTRQQKSKVTRSIGKVAISKREVSEEVPRLSRKASHSRKPRNGRVTPAALVRLPQQAKIQRKLSASSTHGKRSRNPTPSKSYPKVVQICNFFEVPEDEQKVIMKTNPRKPEDEIDAIVGHYLQHDSEDELKYRRQLEREQGKLKKKKSVARKDQVITRSTRVYPGRNARSRENDKKRPVKKIAFEEDNTKVQKMRLCNLGWVPYN